MELKADFFNDWLQILKNILSHQWGYDTSYVSESEIPYLYFNAENRRPKRKKRKVFLADSFVCAPELEAGWKALRKRVEYGESLDPNLTKLVDKLSNKDAMLNDWGVHHFHLGECMVGKFVDRTGPLLFALLADDEFYVIGIFNHGSWVNQDIIEIIHRNWPTVIEKYEMRSDILSTQLTEKERSTLRKSSVNSMVTVKDGTSYFPIGGGLAGQGFNIQAVIETDRQKIMLSELQKEVARRLESWKDIFENHGYRGETEIEASLSIEGTDYIITFPKYGISEVYELK